MEGWPNFIILCLSGAAGAYKDGGAMAQISSPTFKVVSAPATLTFFAKCWYRFLRHKLRTAAGPYCPSAPKFWHKSSLRIDEMWLTPLEMLLSFFPRCRRPGRLMEGCLPGAADAGRRVPASGVRNGMAPQAPG